MEQKIKTLDFDRNIGSVTLSDGVTSLDLPKLSLLKIIKIVKFLGVDGARLYSDCREILLDESYEELEKVAYVLETLKEEQLIHIFSIVLELDDKETLKLDLNEMLDIVLVYMDKTHLSKTFTQVRQIYKKMFKKDLPDFKTLMNQMFPPIEDQEPNTPKATVEAIAGEK